MKVFFIDEQISNMGGVERIINTLANNLINEYDVEVVSEYNFNKNNFFSYNNNIRIKHLLHWNIKSKNYYLTRVQQKIQKKFFLSKRIKSFLLNIHENDILVFGRVTVALHFLPEIEKLNLQCKIIVRDGTNIFCYSDEAKQKIKYYFPRFVNYFIVSSDESIKSYQDMLKNDTIIKKIYNPLGIESFNNYNYNNKKIVSAGRICEQKGFENLLYAFSLIEKKYPEWTLEIYGDGRLKNKMLKLINKLNLQDKAFILPQSKDIVRVYNSASIFISTSRFEGYANVLVEAASCGIPLISFNWLTGVEEIIKDGSNGIIVPLKDRISYFKGYNYYDDAKNLANSIEKLINDKSLCESFSKSNDEIINSRSVDRIIGLWKEIIKH